MKFFNKKRIEMLKGKRLYNYIIYALGEIILVVVGILIALWINNWNNEQQIQSTNRNLQEKVFAQLERDISSIESFRAELDTLDNVYLKVLNRTYDEKKAAKKNIFSIMLFEVTELGLDKNNINWIDNAGLDNSEASEKLIDLSAVYKLYLENLGDYETIIYEKMTNNLQIIEATQSWYTELITDFSCKTDCVKFLTTDETHLARIASLRFLYISAYGDLVKGLYYDLIRFKKELEQIMEVDH